MSLGRTEAAIQRGIDEGAHVGALLEARRGADVVAQLAMGVARPGVAMRPDTVMAWFSATKPLSAAAVVQLWDRAALSLDDTIARYVPAFAAGGKEAITVRHVLTHTAGIPNAQGDLAEVCATPIEPDWVPGHRAAYHPQGAFLVLGEIIRAVDGRSYEAYVSEEILEPLDMGDTWLSLTEERFAAYSDRIGIMHNTTDPKAPVPTHEFEWLPVYGRAHPSRSAVGPVGDLVTFFAALRDGGRGVLSPAAVEAMTARHRAGLVDETFGQIIDWGLGVMVNSWHYRKRPASYGYGDHAGWRAFGHGGAESTLAFADPEHDLAVAIICNGMPGEARNHRRTQRIVNALYADLGIHL
ncbi:MAG TPA: serine hydrolase domain-containing protein [Acidimicrobiales bacterium]|nr:serine hydrolase domain-containing protein [Acidimicrobiales bacterium]